MGNQDYRFTSHGFNEIGDKPSGKIATYKGAYISISNFCNTNICSYCCTRAESRKDSMSIENFKKILAWLSEVSDYPEVYLVGGEPSIVQSLPAFLDEVALNQWKATLYTNGSFGEMRCKELVSNPGLSRVAFHYDPAFFLLYSGFRERWLYNLSSLTPYKECTLIFVIMDPMFDYSDVLSIALAYRLKIAWIFGAPSAGRTPYMGLASMKTAGLRIQKFLLEAHSKGIQTSPDLPIPLCVFEDRFLDKYKDTFKLIRRCRPFAYFTADLCVQSCTALLHHVSSPLSESDKLRKIIEANRMADSILKKKPSFPECVSCNYHLGNICQGGCMTYKVYADSSVEL